MKRCYCFAECICGARAAAKEPTERIVTPEQYAEGYLEATWSDPKMPPIIRSRNYRLIRKLPSGNYVVETPSEHKEFRE